MNKKFLSFFTDIFETIVIALAIFLVVYVFLIQPHRVQGDSMLPNFKNGELILTDKVSYRFRTPKRGDIIVFKSPQDKKKDFIKRVIATKGENVKIEGGKIFINNDLLLENYLAQGVKTISGPTTPESSEFTVPPKQVFVLGDNRSHSSDSREFGSIETADIIGRAFVIYWPPQALALIQGVKY